MQKIHEYLQKERIYLTHDDLRQLGEEIQGLYTVHPRAGPLIILDKSLLYNQKITQMRRST